MTKLPKELSTTTIISYMLTTNDMEKLLTRFPKKLELSYDKLIHKKVHCDVYQAIPYGKKYFAWFTWYKNENVCIFVETNRRLQIFNMFIAPVCFNNDLSYNTILYGTILSNNRFFVTEDIFYYKNTDVSHYNYIGKFKILQKLFKEDIKQTAITDNTVVITMPLTKTGYNELYQEIKTLPYKIYSIAFINFGKRNYRQCMQYKDECVKSATFVVKADIQNDIYNLYCSGDNKTEYHNLAYIPDYKTSVFMNGLFRNIKENICLDTLEESDDEDMFEDVALDKYVDLDKSIKMECLFNRKFKMWTPVKIAGRSNSSIISKKQLLYYEKI